MTRRELEDERTFLLRSLEDLDREHDAGDLSDEDHAVLRDGYVARTAEVLKVLHGGPPPSDRLTADSPDGPRTPKRAASGAPVKDRRHRSRCTLLVVSGLVVVIVCALLSVVAHLGPRLPGETVTGSVTLTPSQQAARNLDQAQILESQGDAADAVKLYASVLRQDPDQDQALAELGWLEYEAGAEAKRGDLLSLGEGDEQRAEKLAPSAFAPHLYLGSMLLAQGDPSAAVLQYHQFLADHPPRAKVLAAVPFITEAFSDAHLPPPSLPVGSSKG
jgi:tetratricopeptide (TPR) repeat protein